MMVLSSFVAVFVGFSVSVDVWVLFQISKTESYLARRNAQKRKHHTVTVRNHTVPALSKSCSFEVQKLDGAIQQPRAKQGGLWLLAYSR